MPYGVSMLQGGETMAREEAEAEITKVPVEHPEFRYVSRCVFVQCAGVDPRCASD